ncbi:hypothetical protein pb186bvf_011864 [Paramecium bursaria]
MFTREHTISSFQESFLSELEVDRIISSCNYGLSKMTQEHDDLNIEISVTKDSIEQFRRQNIQMDSKYRKLKAQNDEIEHYLEMKCKILDMILRSKSKSKFLNSRIKLYIGTALDVDTLRKKEKIKVQNFNIIDTCLHHPGRLKYYSCRQCGQDEYFTCCNKCRECVPGCTLGPHKP